MKLRPQLKNSLIEIASYLYVLLFVYASVSKILDFENFQVQLGQSPLLSAFAGVAAYAVVVGELGISLLLVIPRLRIIGLYLSVALMAMFTTYIIIILNFSSFIPCSCGGILENLGWTEHLIFNIVFVVSGAFAIVLSGIEKTRMILLFCTLITAPSLITMLYLRSEEIMSQENPFIRRFQMFALSEKQSTALENPFFYFAGSDDDHIYLGNHSAPLHIIAFDPQLKKKQHYTIELDNDKFPFRSVEIRIATPYFYLYDGLVPILYRGRIGEWKAKTIYKGNHYFTQGIAVDSTRFAIRGQKQPSGEHILGNLQFKDSALISYSPELLEKQIDGIFDTDGTFNYSKDLKRFVYTYYYRNEFIVSDKNLSLLYRGHTIDTTTKAKLKVARIQKSGDTKLAAPPQMVNKGTTLYNNLLFVNSGLMGRFEEPGVWKHAAIIDVYDILSNQYEFSFYLYGDDTFKPKQFTANKHGVYSIVNQTLYHYKYGRPLQKSLEAAVE